MLFSWWNSAAWRLPLSPSASTGFPPAALREAVMPSLLLHPAQAQNPALSSDGLGFLSCRDTCLSPIRSLSHPLWLQPCHGHIYHLRVCPLLTALAWFGEDPPATLFCLVERRLLCRGQKERTICRRQWVVLCKRQQRTKLLWYRFSPGFCHGHWWLSPQATSDCFLSGPKTTSFSKWFECWMKDLSAWGRWGCVATHQPQRIR